MDIIPAIDLIDAHCVRLSQGDYSSKKEYASDPLEVAKRFEAHGMKRLHLVDLDGAKGGRIMNLPVLERIATHTNLIIDFGGGVKRTEDLDAALGAGASMVTCGSIAVKNRALVLKWLEKHGPERLILGADAKDGLIATTGWLEASSLEVGPFIDSYEEVGMHRVICTDIGCDGMLSGPSFALYDSLLSTRKSLLLIASGGISSMQDVINLSKAGLDGAIIGKAIYEGAIQLEELAAFMEEENAR